MLCCIAIGFFELPGLAGGFLYTIRCPGEFRGIFLFFPPLTGRASAPFRI